MVQLVGWLSSMTSNRDPVDRQDRKTTALMTAEAVIVGFLIAYTPVFNQTIRSSDPKHVFSTVLAALLVYGLALTAFRSILLLYDSMGTADPSNENYLDGYELFLMVVFGSGLYILMNAVSVVHYALEHDVVHFPNECLSIIIVAILFGVWVSLVVFVPSKLAGCVRCTRIKVGNLFRRPHPSVN